MVPVHRNLWHHPHGIVLNASRNLDGSGVGTCLVFLTLVLVSGSTVSMKGLQDQLMELAARNAELTRRLSAVEAASSTPTPEEVLLPSVIDTKLLKQRVAFEGDRPERASWAFTGTRMDVLMEHAQSATDPLDLPTAPSDKQAKYAAISRFDNAFDGRVHEDGSKRSFGSRQWRLLREEYEPRQRRRYQAMLSATLRVQLTEPVGESLDGFERQVPACEDQSGKPTPDERLAATVTTGIDNATLALRLALNDATLDIMGAVRSLVRASMSAEGDRMDVDAMTKGKGEGTIGATR